MAKHHGHILLTYIFFIILYLSVYGYKFYITIIVNYKQDLIQKYHIHQGTFIQFFSGLMFRYHSNRLCAKPRLNALHGILARAFLHTWQSQNTIYWLRLGWWLCADLELRPEYPLVSWGCQGWSQSKDILDEAINQHKAIRPILMTIIAEYRKGNWYSSTTYELI